MHTLHMTLPRTPGMENHGVRVDGIATGNGHRHEASIGDARRNDVAGVEYDARQLSHVLQACLQSWQ